MWLFNKLTEKKNLTNLMDNENISAKIKQSAGYKMAFVMFLLFFTAFIAHSIYRLFPTDFSPLNILACAALFTVYYVGLLNILPIITHKKASDKKDVKKYTMAKSKNAKNLSAA